MGARDLLSGDLSGYPSVGIGLWPRVQGDRGCKSSQPAGICLLVHIYISFEGTFGAWGPMLKCPFVSAAYARQPQQKDTH